MTLTLLSHAHEEDEEEEHDDDNCGSDVSLYPFTMQLQNKIHGPACGLCYICPLAQVILNSMHDMFF
jgi:hypothetical protein